MRLNKNGKGLLAFLFGWFCIVFVLIASIRLVAFDQDLYASFYREEELAKELDVSQEVLEKRLFSLLDYIQNRQEGVDPIFNEREVMHMKDVQRLYVRAIWVQRVCCMGAFLIVFWFFKSEKYAMSYLARGMLQASFCFLVGFCMIAFWAYTDFSDFWYRIHSLFFTNDLWLLNPNTDFMILLCPEELFVKLTLGASFTFLSVFFALNGGSAWFLWKKSVIGFDKMD